MPSKILLVTATAPEAEIIRSLGMDQINGSTFSSGDITIDVLITGVGAISTAWSMKQWISANDKPAFAINAGIAGSYREDIKTGDVVIPVTDCFADAGIEDGKDFLTLYEAGLTGKDDFPFRNGLLYAGSVYRKHMTGSLRAVDAITVNTATGSETTREKLAAKYNPDIETMEGATFFYICLMENIPFLSLRAVSNRVETRNRKNWNIKLALDNLSEKLKEVISNLD
jgi:futalosine hydrolase